ncbi:TetR family transcriptional regulator [Streptomyces sp. NPDC001500]
MAAVAAAAGVGKGTLFRAFADRPGLLRAVRSAAGTVKMAWKSGVLYVGPGRYVRGTAAPLRRTRAVVRS